MEDTYAYLIIVICVIVAGIATALTVNALSYNDDEIPVNNTTNGTNATILNVSDDSSESSAQSDDPYSDRPVNDPNYKGGNPYHEDEITDEGWNPREHEVSREYLPNGNHRIYYDDGYFRVCDSNGYVITYGFG